jgi:Abnormal spindle-like microcephaly-assoc'd, ASPM-SPD-2-Hydin
MCGQQRKASVAWIMSCLAGTILWGCGGGSIASPPPPVLSITFDGGSSQSVPQGGAITITAIIKNDPSAQGVTWKLTGPGALSKQTTMSVEYDAPASVASNVTAMITATAVADPTKSAPFTVTITPPTLISVSLSATTATVAVSTSVKFIATVQNDSANRGVTWNLTQGGTACSPGCGSVAPTSTPSDAPVTYTAPTTVPTNPTLTLTATSASDLSKSALATLTIVPPSIVISVSPTSVLLGVNASQQFTAAVQNDPTNGGVTWALNQGGTVCSAGCGTLSATSSASGTPITYTAPATVPADPVVSIIATVADTGDAIGTSITITVGTVKLVPASLRFGNLLVGTSSPPQTTTLTNTGNTTLNITSNTIPAGPHQGDWSQTNTCAPNIVAGQSCTITVIFKPTAAGPRDTTVSIIDDSVDSPQQVSLQGKGHKPTAAALRSALTTYQTVAAPSPTGPSPVGTRVVDMVDSTRDDPFLANGTKRELVVRFWYPASLIQACQPAQYASPKIWSYFSELVEMRLPEVKTNSCLDAPITDGTHPVVVFTPGYTATFTDSSQKQTLQIS